MEYVQMTLDDWVQMKQKLRQELIGVKQSFVRIGYALRQIDDQRLYENDGYKSIAEFAKAEYGLEASTTSRFISINREYSIDGYSEHLRPEYTDLGRSQLEEMLKLPDSDRQMIQPEASREDIRELKRFNKTEPAAGVADDISQLIEKFFEDNKDILNEVYSNEFDEESMNRFAEIVNPAGNRSFKKGLYFMMMYENRVTIKKFGDTPKNMSWWEFYQVMRSIFDEDAAGTRTWQNHFGGDNEVQENEPTGEHTTAETPESEDDNAAVGEAGTDEVEETESGSVADNEPAPGAGEEQKDDSTDGDTDCREDNREPADRPEEQTGEKSLGEQIAPAQKSPQILEKSEHESWKGNVNYYLESEEVRKWQHAMNVGFDLKGADALKEDGKFGADSQAFAKSHNLWSGQKHYCPTAIKWLRKTLHNVYSFTKLDTDYKEWSDYLSKCVMVFQKNRGLTQDACVGLLTTYRLLKG